MLSYLVMFAIKKSIHPQKKFSISVTLQH